MATKKELINELVELGSTESMKDLEKKTNKQLEKMIKEFPVDEQITEEPSSQGSDMILAMQKQMEEMMSQMKKLQEENEALKEAPVEEKEAVKQTQPMRKTQVEKDRMIPVMNVTPHALVYLSTRTGAEWNWSQYGDIEYIEMQELMTMRSGQRKFLNEPFILILDEEAVNYLGLEKMYDKMVSPEDIDKVFRMNFEKFKEVIEISPRGIQVLIVQRAKELIDKGEFDSMAKINFINDKFNTDLGL